MAGDRDAPSSVTPPWQRGQDEHAPTSDQLDIARRFLEDDQVKDQPKERKVAFLKAKGIDDVDIQKLVDEGESSPATGQQTEDTASSATPSTPTPTSSEASSQDDDGRPSGSPSDRAPIVTYPEFLTKPQSASPPPLVTTAGLLTTLQLSAAFSALLVGSSKLLLSPMLDRLTDSRIDLHAATSSRLDDLVSRLEGTVSTVPPPPSKRTTAPGASDDDISSDAEDPSEMFHRDVGTQTFLPVPSVASAPKLPPSESQSARLESINKSLSEIKDGLRSQSDDLGDVKTLVDVFRDDLDTLTYKSDGFDMYSRTNKPEPEDEMRKVRDSIRRVKGVLLSTKSFPTSMR